MGVEEKIEAKSASAPASVGRGRMIQNYTEVAGFAMEPVTRRTIFLMSWAGAAWLTFAGAMAAGAAVLGRFMLPNVLFEPPMVFKAGLPEKYDLDKPNEDFKTSKKAWIVKLSRDFDGKPHLIALDVTCTHLGCTPNVLFNEGKIKCPCHGSGFFFSGINFEGPAPRPLERYGISIDPVDGQIVVDKTKKFQFEKGQWTDKASYIEV
jgi:cytochrome b6-f complex iron-sulfur subunit